MGWGDNIISSDCSSYETVQVKKQSLKRPLYFEKSFDTTMLGWGGYHYMIILYPPSLTGDGWRISAARSSEKYVEEWGPSNQVGDWDEARHTIWFFDVEYKRVYNVDSFIFDIKHFAESTDKKATFHFYKNILRKLGVRL